MSKRPTSPSLAAPSTDNASEAAALATSTESPPQPRALQSPQSADAAPDADGNADRVDDLSTDLNDDELAQLSDYHDQLLTPEAAAKVARNIANDPRWQAANLEFAAAREAISGMQRARAPSTFALDVEATIAKRSGGAFFARRTLGDRVPFGLFLVVGLVVIGLTLALLWASTTGSLHRPRKPAPALPDASIRPPEPHAP